VDLRSNLLQGGIEMGGLAVLEATPGSFSGLLQAVGLLAEVDAGGLVDSPILVAAVVYPDIAARSLKMLVCDGFPQHARILNPVVVVIRFPASASRSNLRIRALEEVFWIWGVPLVDQLGAKIQVAVAFDAAGAVSAQYQVIPPVAASANGVLRVDPGGWVPGAAVAP
jgi:hypothetical protein